MKKKTNLRKSILMVALIATFLGSFLLTNKDARADVPETNPGGGCAQEGTFVLHSSGAEWKEVVCFECDWNVMPEISEVRGLEGEVIGYEYHYKTDIKWQQDRTCNVSTTGSACVTTKTDSTVPACWFFEPNTN